jgi:hypothetical protein
MTSRFIEDENIDQINERIDNMLNAYDDEEHENEKMPVSTRQQPQPEFDLTKLVGAFSTMFRPVKEIPRPKPKTYISKVFDILLTNILLVIHMLLPEDMVTPAEKFVKDRLASVMEKKIDGMRTDQTYMYRMLLGVCTVVYYMYKFRLLVAFASGFCWGVYLV